MSLNNLNFLSEDDSTFLLNDNDLEYVYNFVKDEVMRGSEISQRSKQDVDFMRGKNSLRLAAVRMHILVHGILPLDMEPNPDWYHVPERMKQFAITKGVDVEDNIDQAKEEGRDRKDSLQRAEQELDSIIQSAMPSIKAFHQNLTKNEVFAWIKLNDIISGLEQQKNLMVRKVHQGQDAMQLVRFELKKVVENLLRDRDAQAKQRELKRLAKQREKELRQRRMGSVWKGVMS